MVFFNINIINLTKLCLIIILFFSLIQILPFDSPFITYVSATSNWVETTNSDFSYGFFDNVTIVGNGTDAKLQISFSDLEMDEWQQLTMSDKPDKRNAHVMATVWGTDKVLLYGGDDGSCYLNDTWVFDMSDNQWTIMSPQINKDIGVIGSSMVPVYGDDKVVLFGGWGGIFDEKTWVYDYSKNNWTGYKPSSSPLPRIGIELATFDETDKVLLFGGSRWDNYPSDTWIYDVSENKWEQKFPHTNPPPRWNHGMATICGTDKILLYGGENNSVEFTETWVYDLSEDNWTEMNPTAVPGKRTHHDLASIFGTDKVLISSDTWIYDYSLNNWIEISPKTEPSPRTYPALSSIYNTGLVLLFGGINGPDETWIYKGRYSLINGTFTSTVHDTYANSSLKTISWTCNTPHGTSIRFQIRTVDRVTDLYKKKFVGPHGKSSRFYSSTPTEIWIGHKGDRWIQYKVYFNITLATASPTLDSITITYNNLPTTILSSPENGSLIKNPKPIFKWNFIDHDSSQQSAFQVLIDNDKNFTSVDYDSSVIDSADQNWEFPTGTKYTILSDNRWFWKVRTKDFAGDWGEFSSTLEFILDAHAPISKIKIPCDREFYAGLNKIIGIAFDGNTGSGIKKVKILIERDRDDKFLAGTDWESHETWLLAEGTDEWSLDVSKTNWVSGMYIIYSSAIDFADNVETIDKVIIFAIDMDRPSSGVENPINNTWVNELNIISGWASDSYGSGIGKVEICIKNLQDDKYWTGLMWSLDKNWVNATGFREWTYDSSGISWSLYSQYIICSRATDRVENVEISNFGNTFWFDNKVPQLTSITINNDNNYTNSNEVILTLNAEDEGSGPYRMTFGINNEDWSNWEPYNTTKALNLSQNDGEKIVKFKVADKAGNVAGPVFDSIILDSSSPTNVSITINNNSKYTTSEIVELNLTAVDSLSGISDMSFNIEGKNWSDWESFTISKLITLPAGDDEKIIYFSVRDKAKNIAIKSDSIILDTTPPHSLYIMINNGAKETDSESVTLNLRALDSLSGVCQMSFSSDGFLWSSWENYTYTKSYVLSEGDEVKTVYFKVMDEAGNIAEPIKTTIKLKTKSSTSVLERLLGNLIIGVILIIGILIITIIIIFLKRKFKSEQMEYDMPQTTIILPTFRKKVIDATTSIKIQPTITPTVSNYSQLSSDQLYKQMLKQQFSKPSPKVEQDLHEICLTCGQPMYLISPINKYYCYHCQKYD